MLLNTKLFGIGSLCRKLGLSGGLVFYQLD